MKRDHVARQRAVEAMFFAGFRVFKAQKMGVEGLTAETRERRLSRFRELRGPGSVGRAIERVSQNGVAHMGHMDPDLVGSTSLEMAGYAGHEGIIGRSETLLALIVGYRVARALCVDRPGDSDFEPVVPRAGQRRINRALGGVWTAPDIGRVGTLQAAILPMGSELGLQAFKGRFGLGDDHDAARILVEPVDDPGTLFAANALEVIAAMGEQGVYQRSVRCAGCRMDDHASRLVDDDEMSVFKEYGQGNVLGFRFRGFGGRQCQAECFTGFDPVRRLNYRPRRALRVHHNLSGFDKLAQSGSARRRIKVRTGVRQKAVQA